MPDPTTVTLCFCSREPKVAIALAPEKLEVASSCFEGSELRSEAERLARRRRAAPLEVAIVAVVIGRLEVRGVKKLYCNVVWLVTCGENG